MALQIGRSRLPELLAANHMSQAEFARSLGVSEAFVSQVISGMRYFSLPMAYRAARLLKCNVEDLHDLSE